MVYATSLSTSFSLARTPERISFIFLHMIAAITMSAAALVQNSPIIWPRNRGAAAVLKTGLSHTRTLQEIARAQAARESIQQASEMIHMPQSR